MTVLQHDEPEQGQLAHLYHRETVDGSGGLTFSDPVYVTDFPVSVSISCGTSVSAAGVYYTMTPRSILEASMDPITDGVWHLWPKGSAFVDGDKAADAILGPVTAVAIGADGGDVIFEVLQKAPGI